MKSMQSNQTRQHDVKLTLNEELVSQTNGITSNLSGVVSQSWNGFNERSGSFADEHSTL